MISLRITTGAFSLIVLLASCSAPPEPGILNINTLPGHARIYINGDFKGTSSGPLEQGFSVRLKDGYYTIEAVRAENDLIEYVGKHEKFRVVAGTTQTLSIKLDRSLTQEGVRQALERERRAQEDEREGARIVEEKRRLALKEQEEALRFAEELGFVANRDGTVTDRRTGLSWMRCTLGQEWDGATCMWIGQKVRVFSWDEAKESAAQLRTAGFAGKDDWRLPTAQELATLIYCDPPKVRGTGDLSFACRGDYQKPTTVQSVFPNTPSSRYWTISGQQGRSEFNWFVNFDEGNSYAWHREGASGFVRLVRDGE